MNVNSICRDKSPYIDIFKKGIVVDIKILKMAAALAKISKAGGAQPDEFEVQVATEIHHLEVRHCVISF